MSDVSLNSIKKDLSNIRYYFLYLHEIEGDYDYLRELYQKYDRIAKDLPAKFYSLYFHLYHLGYTQSQFAFLKGYSCKYVYKLNKELVSLMQKSLCSI